jgi:hypothetical protein
LLNLGVEGLGNIVAWDPMIPTVIFPIASPKFLPCIVFGSGEYISDQRLLGASRAVILP